jgi:hypothetical protein
MRTILAAPLLIAFSASRVAAQGAAGCDRACLAGAMTAHVAAVDEENDTVLLWMDFGLGSLPGPPNAPPRSLVTFEAFKVYGGQVHAVEAVFEGMPPNTPSGWR